MRLRRTVARRRSPLLLAPAAAAAAAAALLLPACGGDAAETATALIEGQLAEEIGLGDLNATCNQPAEPAEGETFACTAITADGETIEFVGELTSSDELNVQTTNLLTADDVDAIVPAIADAVGAEVGAEVLPEDLTCPDGSIILDDAGDFDCEIVDRATGEVYTITIQTGGLTPGGGPQNLGFLIDDLVEP